MVLFLVAHDPEDEIKFAVTRYISTKISRMSIRAFSSRANQGQDLVLIVLADPQQIARRTLNIRSCA